MKKVSIVVPTFNRSELLKTAVESAMHAYSGPFEIIIVDDASTDDTPKVCASMERVRYVRQATNRGLAAARNEGAAQSSGEFLVFLDDDDELLSKAIDGGVETLNHRPEAGFFYAQARVKHYDGSIAPEPFPGRCPDGDLFWECVTGFAPCVHTVVVRRAAFDAVGGFGDGLRHFEDLDLWVRLSERFEVVASMDEVAIYREVRPGSGQLSSRTSHRAGLGLALQENWLKLPRALAASPAKRSEARRKLLDRTSDLLLFGARTALDEGLRDHARMNVLTALRLHPSRAFRPWTLKMLLRTIL